MSAVAENILAPNTADRPGTKIILPGQTPQGDHILSVLVKRTYDIGSDGRCVRASADYRLISGDIHYGDPMSSTVKLESDFVPHKQATDVVLNGRAFAPDGQRVSSLRVSLVIDKYRKDLLVLGDRVAKHNGKKDPI